MGATTHQRPPSGAEFISLGQTSRTDSSVTSSHHTHLILLRDFHTRWGATQGMVLVTLSQTQIPRPTNEADGHLYLLKIHQNWTRAPPGLCNQPHAIQSQTLAAPSELQGPATNTLLNLHIHAEKYLKLKSLKPTPPARFIPSPKGLPPCCSTNKPIGLSSRHPCCHFPEPPCRLAPAAM